MEIRDKIIGVLKRYFEYDNDGNENRCYQPELSAQDAIDEIRDIVGCSETSTSDAVYVLISETPDDGKEVDAIYATLDRAQEIARQKFAAYKAEFKAQMNYEPEVCWYGGIHCLWGWYAVNESLGCYIRKMKITED